MSHPSLKAAVTVFLWDFSDVWEKIWAISGAAANRTKGFQQVCKPQQLSSLISVSRLDCHSFSFSFILSIRLSAFTPQTCMFESELLLYLERKLLRSKSSQLKENCCVVRRHLCVFSRLESNMSLFQASVLCDNRLNISVVTSAHMCQSQLHTVQRFLTRVSRQNWIINWTLTLDTFSDLYDEGLWRHWTSWIHCCLISRRFLTQLFNPSGALERGQDNKVQDYYYLNWQELQRSIRQLTESFESFSVKTLISFLSSLSFI